MPDVVVKQQDVLDLNTPALSSTNDMPVIETKPDSVPAKEPEAKPETPPEAKEPVAEAKPEEPTPPEQPDDPSAEPEPKKAKGVQKRIDELTRQREDERRRAEAAEARLDRALAALEKSGGVKADTVKQSIDSEDPEPQKPVKDPNNPEAYDAALENYVSERSSWIARREVKASLAEEEKKRQDSQLAETYRVRQETFRQKVEKAKEKYTDYQEFAESPDVKVSPIMAQGIFSSEDGPEIAYFLGKNPAEAERISKLAPEMQLVELGKVSAKLSTPAPTTKPVSAAPAPGKPTKPSSETVLSPEEESMEAYAARRKKELAERNRPGVRH